MEVENAYNTDFTKPTILISNHPSTLMDVLNCAILPKEQVHFLANAGLFATPFTNWLFTNLYCVPIRRATDKGGNRVDNKKSFEQCDLFLGNGGMLWIAPEGGSMPERTLRSLKTGTARIGLSAEDKQDFNLDLTIVPIGLNYSAPQKFRSTLLVNIGEAISLKDFEAEYKEEAFKTAKDITALLTEKLRPLIIDTENEEEDQFIQKIEQLYQNSAPSNLNDVFLQTKQFIDQYRIFKKEQPKEAKAFDQSVTGYFEKTAKFGITDQALFYSINDSSQVLGLKLIGVVLGFPVFLFGWLNNLLPTLVPALITKLLKLYPGYTSTAKMGFGILSFPLFYFIQYRLVSAYLSWPWPFIYLILLPITGFFALWYMKKAEHVLQNLKLWFWRLSNKEAYQSCAEDRVNIWQEVSKVATLPIKS